MPSQAMEKLVEKGDRAVAALRNYRAKNKAQGLRYVGAAEQIAGGMAAGAADAYFDEPKVLGLPAVPMASAAALLLGLSEIVPGAEHIAQLGAGGLAYAAGSLTFKKVNGYEEP